MECSKQLNCPADLCSSTADILNVVAAIFQVLHNSHISHANLADPMRGLMFGARRRVFASHQFPAHVNCLPDYAVLRSLLVTSVRTFETCASLIPTRKLLNCAPSQVTSRSHPQRPRY